MNSLNDNEKDEIESIKHKIKYILKKPNVQDLEIYRVIMELDEIGKKYIISNKYSQNEFNELMDLDDVKNLISRFLINIMQKSSEK